MNRLLRPLESVHWGSRSRNKWIAMVLLRVCRWYVMDRHGSECLAVEENQTPELRLADSRRILEHGFEHRLKFTGRGADYLQHFGRRSLPIQRFAQFAEQSRVLDCYDRLSSEAFRKVDVLV